MNQLDGSKFCHKICHIFGDRVVKECKRYLTLHNFQPLVAHAYKKIFDFCEKNVNMDRLWMFYGYCQDKAQTLCRQKCPQRAVEDCVAYVDKKLLDREMIVLKSYERDKEASETTYFTVIVQRKVLDFCKSSQNTPKIVEKFDFDRIIDEVVSMEEEIIYKGNSDITNLELPKLEYNTTSTCNDAQKKEANKYLELSVAIEDESSYAYYKTLVDCMRACYSPEVATKVYIIKAQNSKGTKQVKLLKEALTHSASIRDMNFKLKKEIIIYNLLKPHFSGIERQDIENRIQMKEKVLHEISK